MTASSSWRRLIALLAVGAALSVLVSACGDDGGSSSATTAESEGTEGTDGTSPEDVIVPDSEVTAGLDQSIADMHTLADGVAAGTATEDQFEEIHEGWESYEGTIKQNNPEAYLGLEDALAAMQGAVADKDAEAASGAADDFEADATAYMAEHP